MVSIRKKPHELEKVVAALQMDDSNVQENFSYRPTKFFSKKNKTGQQSDVNLGDQSSSECSM
jgi:hypothetical protein